MQSDEAAGRKPPDCKSESDRRLMCRQLREVQKTWLAQDRTGDPCECQHALIAVELLFRKADNTKLVPVYF
jgi:hypothetical protein